MADNIHVHLQMIQGVVTRLGHNSFLLKGWSVILVAALLAFAANTSDRIILLVTFVPIVAFWGLDGYYLWQERRFRALYNHVRRHGPHDMNYDLNVGVSDDAKKIDWLSTVCSRTLIGFYGTIFLTVAIILAVASARVDDDSPSVPLDPIETTTTLPKTQQER